jgi:phosphoribosylformylglycinamidine synthase
MVRAAAVYVLSGALSDEDYQKVKGYLINPVESREASPEKPETLRQHFELPGLVSSVEGFCEMDTSKLEELLTSLGLAMDLSDLLFLQKYFQNERRDRRLPKSGSPTPTGRTTAGIPPFPQSLPI